MSEVVTLTAAACRRAGELLAARHASERQRFPLLPVAYEDPARAADLVRNTLSFCDGVAAVDDRGDLVGFLTSFDSAPDPTSPIARYSPPVLDEAERGVPSALLEWRSEGARPTR